MIAAHARRHDPAAGPAAADGDLAQIRAAIQVVARVTANAVALGAKGPWTDFRLLLQHQYSVSETDAAAFLDILAGRLP